MSYVSYVSYNPLIVSVIVCRVFPCCFITGCRCCRPSRKAKDHNRISDSHHTCATCLWRKSRISYRGMYPLLMRIFPWSTRDWGFSLSCRECVRTKSRACVVGCRVLNWFKERFSFECLKTKTKEITLTNHNRRKQHNGAKRGKTRATELAIRFGFASHSG